MLDAQITKSIALGCDETGLGLKNEVAVFLGGCGYDIKDYGCHTSDPIDYPDVAFEVADAVRRGEHDRAILICGTGIGMAIAANKVRGVRATVAHDTYSAERARKSNDAQVLALGARVVGPELAKTIVRAWLASEFAGGNSARKVQKIQDRDEELFA